MTSSPSPAALPLDVLVVGDSAEDAGLIAQELDRAGYAPHGRRVATETEMAAALDECHWDLVLCDHALKHFDYHRALALVREKRATAPVLLFCSSITAEAAIAAVKAGARDIIMKDRLSRLAHAVERELDAAHSRASQRRLEEEIRRSEKRFRALIEHSFDAVCLIDSQATLQYISPAAERILGYTAEELIGRNALDLIEPDDRALAQGILADIASVPRHTRNAQIRARRKDGAQIWTEQVGTNLLHEESVSAVVVNFRDITEQKLFEQKLRDKEEHAQAELAELEHIYDTAPVGLCLLGPDLRYLRINGRLAAMNGVPAEAHRGRAVWEVLPEVGPLVAPLLRRILDSGQPLVDWEFRTGSPEAPGGQRDFLASYYPVRTAAGKVLGVAGAVQEITELKRVERALRQSEQRFRALIENSADGFVILSAEGIIRYTGPSILGYSNTEFLDRLIFDLVHPDEHERLRSTLDILSRSPGKFVPSEFRLLHKEGSWRDVEAVSKNLLHDPAVGGIIVNYRDVTERKRLEEQLRQTQKLESIGVLAGGVAHDFNNLLTGILGNASLALDMLSPTHPSRSHIEDVRQASESAAHLTRQLLAYSGKGRFIIQPVDLSDLTQEMTALVRTSIPRTVQLRLELASGLPAVEADPGQLQQLVMNLILNGAEAIGERRAGRVLVSTGTGVATEELSRRGFAATEVPPGRHVWLRVQDNGSGMDQETLSRIFDPFFTTKFSGRGLGLSAVLGIVRGHKGAIKVESAPGQGTTFEVLLPASAHPVAKSLTRGSQADLRGTGTILVVDDEEMVRRTAKAALERQGYSVLTASNGREAVELFRIKEGRVALVLLDLTMPVLGGEAAVPELQQVRPDVKILLTSGFNEAEAVERFNGKGLAGFIQKPYTAGQLAEKIKRVLEGSG